MLVLSTNQKMVRIPWGAIHLILSKFLEICFGIYIGVAAKIGQRIQIEHFGNIIIQGATTIGDDCIIRQGVTTGNRNLISPLDAPVIGSNVNIGAGAKILGKVLIVNNVGIGANAVVITDIPANHITVDVPAVIKQRKNYLYLEVSEQ